MLLRRASRQRRACTTPELAPTRRRTDAARTFPPRPFRVVGTPLDWPVRPRRWCRRDAGTGTTGFAVHHRRRQPAVARWAGVEANGELASQPAVWLLWFRVRAAAWGLPPFPFGSRPGRSRGGRRLLRAAGLVRGRLS